MRDYIYVPLSPEDEEEVYSQELPGTEAKCYGYKSSPWKTVVYCVLNLFFFGAILGWAVVYRVENIPDM